ncbi:sugar phosphate exchanger 3 isoform X3 [Panthera tigris]|uniref:sugar phosphate exchanger 3 isoform X3 n=1 Tax=Panthera tigris TaxID=9694 RepID=UPI001C6F7A5C|nr:sugar phosphate exchanger 3 isoform X3 [Panthera tigris]
MGTWAEVQQSRGRTERWWCPGSHTSMAGANSLSKGLFISGIVGDRLNLRWVLSFGMCSSALVVFVFGPVTEWLHFYNKGLYCCLWIGNGLLQSTGWPCVVAVMGNWFGKAGRGVVFGLWSACASVGNILGACLASSVLQYGYEYAFLVTAAVQFAGGIIIFFGLLVSPEEIGIPGIEAEENFEEDSHRPLINGAENEDEYEPNYSIQEGSTTTQVKAISFYQACCLPGVIPYSLAYACLKLVNYSFFFWLPFYLSNNFGWKEAEADKLSIWYDVGGIIGGTLQGFVSDVLQKRAPVLALSLLLAVGSLVGYSRSPNDKSINALLMAVTGFFIGGPSNMISSAISADLGHQELIQGSSEALATVTGIVDGTGSIGAAVGQYLVSLIQDNLGWMWVFYFFILMVQTRPSSLVQGAWSSLELPQGCILLLSQRTLLLPNCLLASEDWTVCPCVPLLTSVLNRGRYLLMNLSCDHTRNCTRKKTGSIIRNTF